MTWLNVVLYGPGWLACAWIPVDWWLDRRFRRRYEERWGVPYDERTFPVGGGEVTITAPMSQADYEDLKARWLQRYGQSGAACDAYQPPATAADTGLCARCGMYDYKHQEQPDA